MPIKKSYLEQKWYYRVAKVFFWVLPFLVIAIMFLRVGGNILGILQKNIVYIIYIAIGLVLYLLILKIIWRGFLYIVFGGLEDDTKSINSANQSVPVKPKPVVSQVIPIIIIVGVIAVFALSQTGYIKLPKLNFNSGDWSSHQYGASCKTSDGETGLYGTNGTCYTCSEGTAVTNPVNNNCSSGIAGVYCCGTASNGGNKNSKCIPTGCGSLWRCSGSYYISGVQIRVSGACFPSGLRPGDIYSGWSGTCRQCP